MSLSVALLFATTLASSLAGAHPIDDFINCPDNSCGDICDTTWLKYTANTPETPTKQSTESSATTATSTKTEPVTSPTVPITATKPLPTDPVVIPGETNICPDPTYQVPLTRTVINNEGGKTYSFVPADRQDMQAAQEKIGFKTDYEFALYTAGCIISMDRLFVLQRICQNATECVAPLCHTIFRENGRLQYRLRVGSMPDKCPQGGELVGYAITKYDCCGAIAPVNELWRTNAGYPDWWLEIGDGGGQWKNTDGYRNWYSVGLPFFSWPVLSKAKVEVCPDRKYMAPLVWTYDHRTYTGPNYCHKRFYYYFLMSDKTDFEKVQKESEYRVEYFWRTGCAVRKDGLEELSLACPDYKTCVKPLCSTRRMDPVTGKQLYRLETADWQEPLCGKQPHIGYIPTTPGCCGANQLLRTMTREAPCHLGYFYSPVPEDTIEFNGWKLTSRKDFYIWQTIPLLR